LTFYTLQQVDCVELIEQLSDQICAYEFRMKLFSGVDLEKGRDKNPLYGWVVCSTVQIQFAYLLFSGTSNIGPAEPTKSQAGGRLFVYAEQSIQRSIQTPNGSGL